MENLDPHFTRGVPCCWVEIWTQTFVDLSGCDESGNLAIESMEINPSPIITETIACYQWPAIIAYYTETSNAKASSIHSLQ